MHTTIQQTETISFGDIFQSHFENNKKLRVNQEPTAFKHVIQYEESYGQWTIFVLVTVPGLCSSLH